MSQSIPFQVLNIGASPFADRQVLMPQILVFRDSLAWIQFWQSSTKRDLNFQPIAAPEVDFTHQMVIGFTAGSHSTGGFQLQVHDIEARSTPTGDQWMIHYTEQFPGHTPVTQQPTTPCVFMLTELVDGKIELTAVSNSV